MSNTNHINNGGPAFPVSSEIYNGTGLCGMTLRDWFAGQALNGLLACSTHIGGEDAANWSFQFADAMIAARNKQPSQL